MAFISAAAALALLVAGSAGCGRAKPRNPDASGLRIVSLSPAITHAIEALGAGGLVVGCTPWCGAQGALVVGSLEDRNAEAIVALQPTLLVRQGDQPDAALDPVLTARGAAIRGWRLNSVADVVRCVQGLGRTLDSMGTTGCAARADRVIMDHLDAVGAQVALREPVVFLFSVDPPTAFGADNYVDDLWRAMGGTNAVTISGYPAVSAEDVLRMRPAAIAVITAQPSPTLPPWLAGRKDVHIIHAPVLLEPSTAMLVDGPAALRRLDAAAGGGGRS